MENELVREVKKTCTKVEKNILETISNFEGKGISGKDLDVLKYLIGEVQVVRFSTKNNNAEEMRERISVLQDKVDEQILKLNKLVYNGTEYELKNDYYNTQQDVAVNYHNYLEKGLKVEDVAPLAAIYHELKVEYDAINSKNLYEQNNKLKDIVERIAAIKADLDKKVVIAEPAEVNEEEEEAVPVENVSEPKKGSKLLKVVIAGGVIAGALFGLSRCSKDTKNNTRANTQTVEETEKKEETAVEVVTLKPGEIGTFTDAKSEEQIEARAKWYYENYVNDKVKDTVTIEDIKNDIRMFNGNFMLDEQGNVTYNDQDIINAAVDLHTIANYDSLMNNEKLEFTPLAPLFVDGSKAQEGAKALDDKMLDVVNAINNKDDEAFMRASEAWGSTVLNMFHYYDFKEGFVNVHQVEAPTSFALFHAMNSKYASTILEYSEKKDINICIPYCVDFCTGETKLESLSNIMYMINERAIDAVAVRSGNLKEYEANNLTLPEDLLVQAQNYYHSKYDLEIGKSRSLK